MLCSGAMLILNNGSIEELDRDSLFRISWIGNALVIASFLKWKLLFIAVLRLLDSLLDELFTRQLRCIDKT